MPFIPLCSAADLPGEGELKAFTVQGVELCVARSGGSLAAVNNSCPHQGGPLAEGTIENGSVVCPWHSWAFSLRTGKSVEAADQPVAVYPLQITGDQVLVQLEA